MDGLFRIPVGPIRVHIDAPRDLRPHPAASLMEGFSLDPSRQRPLSAHMRLRRAERIPEHCTETMRFRSDGAGAWVDESEGWVARFEGLLGASATSVLVDTRPCIDSRSLWSRTISHLLRALVPAMLSGGGGLLVHGCAMRAPDGHAVVFLGASGEGKSTMATRLPGWTLLADDHVLLELADDGVMASGTFFAGKERLPRREAAATVGALAFLRKGAPTLSVSRLNEAAAFSALMRRTLWFMEDPELTQGVVDVAAEVVARLHAFELASGLEHRLADAAWSLATGGQP